MTTTMADSRPAFSRSVPSRLVLVAALGMTLAGCGIFKHGGHKTPTVGERVPILVSEQAAEVDKTLANVTVSLPPATVNESWAQAGGSADKSNGQLALGASPQRLWTATITGGTERARLGASPVIDGGKLFAIDVDAVVHAIDANSGAALWQTPLAEGVYVLSQDNQLFALSEADGSVVWTQTGSIESQGVFGVAAPASSQGTVVAGFSSGELNAYRYENGRTLWQDALSRTSATTSVSSLADVDADPVIEDGRVYAVGQGGRMVAVDISTGQRVWEQNFAGISTPWIAGEWLFIVTDDARLVCVARATGKVRWITQLQHYRKEKARKDQVTWFGPVLAGGRLILTNSLGQLAYRSPTDGAAISDEKQKVPYTLPPVVANSTLYTIDQRGRISAYR